MYETYAYPYGNPDAKLLLYRPNDPQALVLSPKLTREVSKGGSLVFTMTRDHAQYDMLQKLSTYRISAPGSLSWTARRWPICSPRALRPTWIPAWACTPCGQKGVSDTAPSGGEAAVKP